MSKTEHFGLALAAAICVLEENPLTNTYVPEHIRRMARETIAKAREEGIVTPNQQAVEIARKLKR